jgi:hypothetical protein
MIVSVLSGENSYQDRFRPCLRDSSVGKFFSRVSLISRIETKRRSYTESPNFISKQFNRFFHLNNAVPVLNQLNEEVYHRLHQKSLYQPTRREKQLHIMIQDPVITPVALQTKIWNKAIMYPRYLFDTGLTINLPKEFYKWWKTYYAFPGSPLENIKVRIVTDTNRTLESFFIHKKPSQQMLRRMEPT